MSVRHHMNWLSPYARGLVHGFAYGWLSTLATGGLVWILWKLH